MTDSKSSTDETGDNKGKIYLSKFSKVLTEYRIMLNVISCR